MQKEAPEDRLLRLIKGKSKKKEPPVPQVSSTDSSVSTQITKKIFFENKILKVSFLKPAAKILTAILIMAIIYFINSFLFNPYKNVSSILRQNETAPINIGIGPEENVILPAPGEDYSLYKETMESKNLFTGPLIKEDAVGREAIDVAKRFSLVGIIAGDEPQAILEDKETQKTYYLARGQSFDGATVIEITEGKVILDYQGRQIALFL